MSELRDKPAVLDRSSDLDLQPENSDKYGRLSQLVDHSKELAATAVKGVTGKCNRMNSKTKRRLAVTGSVLTGATAFGPSLAAADDFDPATIQKAACLYDAKQGYIDVSGKTDFSRTRVPGKKRSHVRAATRPVESYQYDLCVANGTIRSTEVAIGALVQVRGYNKWYEVDAGKKADGLERVVQNLELPSRLQCTPKRKALNFRRVVETSVTTGDGHTYTDTDTMPAEFKQTVKCPR